MATMLKRLGAFGAYTGKVVLPVVLGSLIFGGILAKYNNEMNLNKTILESAYQPMREQSRKCFWLHAQLEERLSSYRGLIDEIRGLIDHDTKPPPEVLKNPGDAAFPGPGRIVAMQQAWRDSEDCNFVFAGYLGDLSILLGEDAAGLDPLIHQNNRQLDNTARKKDQVFKRLHELDLGQVFGEMGQASPNQIATMKPKWGNDLRIASESLGELIDMAKAKIHAYIGYSDQGTAIAAEAMKRRFHAGPFDFVQAL